MTCGDSQSIAWPSVYHEQREFVYSIVRRLSGPELDADDLAQDVFVVVHQKLASLRDPQRLRSWLYGICRRVVARERRKKKLRKILWERWGGSVLPARSTPEQEAHSLEQERQLYRALDKLTSRRREIIVLFALHEMSGKEIASLLGIPEATVWSRLHEARKQLLAEMSKDRELAAVKECLS